MTLASPVAPPRRPGSSKLYEDGVLVATNNNLTIKPSQIGEPDGTTTRNFSAGRRTAATARSRAGSATSASTRRALDAAEAAAQSAEDADRRGRGRQGGADPRRHRGGHRQPDAAGHRDAGSTITWAHRRPATVADAGAVTRPSHGAASAASTLTATITHGAVTQDEGVPGHACSRTSSTTPARRRTRVDAIELVHPDDVRGNLTLPTTGCTARRSAGRRASPTSSADR